METTNTDNGKTPYTHFAFSHFNDVWLTFLIIENCSYMFARILSFCLSCSSQYVDLNSRLKTIFIPFFFGLHT